MMGIIYGVKGAGLMRRRVDETFALADSRSG